MKKTLNSVSPFYVLFVLVVFFVSIVSAHANDSMARAIGGGLVLLKKEDIAMVSEELYLSAEKIEVNYVFKNLTNKDITTTVAFPLPEVPDPTDGPDAPDMIFHHPVDPNSRIISEDARVNYVAFKVWVDGKQLSPKSHSERKIGTKAGDFEGEEVWQLTYSWRQTFPAGKSIHVRHIYKPILGEQPSFYTPDGNWDHIMFDEGKYCPDEQFRNAALFKKMKPGRTYVSQGRSFGYVLKTGANWAGGTIGDFRLVVDKLKPDAIVTFCGKNVKKISPTQFEMRAKNYRPTKDINVFVISDLEEFGMQE